MTIHPLALLFAPIPPDDVAERVAAEHVVWAATQGLRPADILASVGAAPPPWRDPDWHDAVAVLADLWRVLAAEDAAPGSAAPGSAAAEAASPPPFPAPVPTPADWRIAA